MKTVGNVLDEHLGEYDYVLVGSACRRWDAAELDELRGAECRSYRIINGAVASESRVVPEDGFSTAYLVVEI